ncbi:hypothetical protein FRAAL3576 [Frankia alni ACN14a]|uniref:Uncharacterized protein n=1 Tax=Frankia alni (strain DSM 45986 / CECT 9034 / ACN14a) TaxID=326424 RepID=Q0RJU1_FRAAA|nr:hypothetical protein FRAAL3576 [Frankia alni ACN14a]
MVPALGIVRDVGLTSDGAARLRGIRMTVSRARGGGDRAACWRLVGVRRRSPAHRSNHPACRRPQ